MLRLQLVLALFVAATKLLPLCHSIGAGDPRHSADSLTAPGGIAILKFPNVSLAVYDIFLTVGFELNNKKTNFNISNAAAKVTHQMQVGLYFNKRYKITCTVKFNLLEPSFSMCMRRFDFTQYLDRKVKSLYFQYKAPGALPYSVANAARNLVFTAYTDIVFVSKIKVKEVTGQSGSARPSEFLWKHFSITDSLMNSTDSYRDTYIERLENGFTSIEILQKWVKPSKILPFSFPVLSRRYNQYYFITSEVKILSTVESGTAASDGKMASASFLFMVDSVKPVPRETANSVNNANKQTCDVRYLMGKPSFASCLHARDISSLVTVPTIERSKIANISVAMDVLFVGSTKDLAGLNILVRVVLHVLPSPFHNWGISGGVSDAMVDCYAYSNNLLHRHLNNQVVIRVSNGGNVSAEFANLTQLQNLNKERSSLPHRVEDIVYGVQMSIEYAKRYMRIDYFPDLHFLFWPGDEPAPYIYDERAKVAKLSSDRPSCLAATSAPPVFAQNRDYSPGNFFVLIPDFSFFSRFADRSHDHGTTKDNWFGTMDKEFKFSGKPGAVYSSKKFSMKKKTAIFRGRAQSRRFGGLRSAISKCGNKGLINSSPRQFIDRENMCRDHQAVITTPGNGVWSWATKFNLLCNSVTIMTSSEEIGGESWETRAAMGLVENVHYLAISANVSTVCSELEKKVMLIRNNQPDAEDMAYAARYLTMQKLNKDMVLRDFATILLEYASLNASKTKG